MENGILKDKFLLAAMIITAIYAAYWMSYSLNAYNTFHDFDDLGIFAHNMYIDLNYPSLVPGLQFLIFGNHIAPDQLIVMLFFFLDQSAVTLLVIQVLVLSATVLTIFIVSRRLTGNQAISFLFFLAFVLNPGVAGMPIFDYHTEALIILFYVLSFYFYMRLNKLLFFVSLILLLCTIETAPYLGIALGAGLLIYTYFYGEKDHTRSLRLKLAISAIVVSIIFVVLFDAISASLSSAYASGAYASLPTYLKVSAPVSGQLSQAATNAGSIFSDMASFGYGYIIYGIIAAFLLFGMVVLFDPLITLILASPFIAETFLVQNLSFLLVWNQYYSFVTGCVFAGAVLGLIKAQKKQGVFAGFLVKTFKDYEKAIFYMIAGSLLAVTIILLALWPTFVLSKNTNNISQDFFFQVSPQQHAYYGQLYSILALVPQNASLMVPFFVTPHVADREYLEDTGYTMEQWYFRPEYIVVDANLNVSLNAYSGLQQLVNYTENNTYTLYAKNGSALLLKYSG